MIATVRLGVRLAGAGVLAGTARARSALVALAATVGTLILLLVAGIAHAETAASSWAAIDAEGMPQLLTAVVITVSLPVLALAGAVGRLSASVRDQRFGNLRLLGMTSFHTRLVATVETGLAACAGTALAAVVSLPTRALLATAQPSGTRWTYESLTPGATGYLLVLPAVPLVITGVAASFRSAHETDAVAVAQGVDARIPGLWRLLPLAAGIGISIYVINTVGPSTSGSDIIPLFFAGVIALGVGIMLVLPVVARLIAAVITRLAHSPALRIAGRRLQVQPAGASRVVTALLVGLFIVTGSQGIIASYKSLPQYQSYAEIETIGQLGAMELTGHDPSAVLRDLRSDPRVQTVAMFGLVAVDCGSSDDPEPCRGWSALVGSCTDLNSVMASDTNCRDDAVGAFYDGNIHEPIEVFPLDDEGPIAGAPGLMIPPPTYHLNNSTAGNLPTYASGFIPTALAGSTLGGAGTQSDIWVRAVPGVPILSVLDKAAGAWSASLSAPDADSYDTAHGFETLAAAVAAVVLAVGLLAFAVGAIDRALTRRRELVSLQLIGVSPTVLRRSQWWETALPLTFGVALAISCGALAGRSYLAIAWESWGEWSTIVTLGAVSVIGSLVIAGLTVIATNVRVTPENIRAE